MPPGRLGLSFLSFCAQVWTRLVKFPFAAEGIKNDHLISRPTRETIDYYLGAAQRDGRAGSMRGAYRRARS